MFGLKKIEPLLKFLIKALAKVIKAGNKIIQAYGCAEPKIAKLKIIIATVEDVLEKVEKLSKEEEDTEVNEIVAQEIAEED